MRFATTPQFTNDFKKLRAEHRAQFKACVPDFNVGCERYLETGLVRSWKSSLRVTRMTGTDGVWEMTWSFSGPDGRATFQFIDDPDGMVVLWRRVGSHRIYRAP